MTTRAALKRHAVAHASNFVAAIGALSLVLSSCALLPSTSPPIGDGGLLSHSPCVAPCFFGVEPGVTLLGEAKSILTSDSVCREPTDFDNESVGGSRGFKCGEWITVSTIPDGELVGAVGFSTVAPVTVESAVGSLGEPDWVSAIPTGVPEAPKVVLLLYFDDYSTRLLLPEQDGRGYLLQADTPLERILYMARAEYLASRGTGGPWTGYGIYNAGP